MPTGIIPLISPQTHRRIDQLTFPGLLATAAWMARRDRRAAAVTLMTAAIEGMAHVTTDYPPAFLPLMSFRTHNRVAAAHGALVMALGLSLPGLTRRGRMALCALGTMPITLAAFSDVRGGTTPSARPSAPIGFSSGPPPSLVRPGVTDPMISIVPTTRAVATTGLGRPKDE